jgi:non-heme chloroperoxidase
MIAIGPDQPHQINVLPGGEGAIRYLDTGEQGWHPVVFFGGIGTSAGAFCLTEFARGERTRLRLRFVSVERNGFGETPFRPERGYAEAVDDVLRVMARLRLARYSVVAVSGGGPYAARLIAHAPERVVSIHLAAAVAGGELAGPYALAAALPDVRAIAEDPEGFWEYPPTSPVYGIPGFRDAASAEGRRALGERTRAELALSHELALLRAQELPGLKLTSAPAFLYWGARDELVSREHLRAWRSVLPPGTTLRVYPDAGHDVQYLHWPAILRDISAAAGLR